MYLKKYLKVTTKEHVMQGSSNLFLEGRCPAEFSSNPNQTHLKQLIKVLLGILQTARQVCWGKLELNSAGHRPSRTECGDPWCNANIFKINSVWSMPLIRAKFSPFFTLTCLHLSFRKKLHCVALSNPKYVVVDCKMNIVLYSHLSSGSPHLLLLAGFPDRLSSFARKQCSAQTGRCRRHSFSHLSAAASSFPQQAAQTPHGLQTQGPEKPWPSAPTVSQRAIQLRSPAQCWEVCLQGMSTVDCWTTHILLTMWVTSHWTPGIHTLLWDTKNKGSYTLKNKGASWCHRRTFLSKWFHKEPLTSEEPFCFTKGSLLRKKVLQIIKR